jgi:hypothetical protein
MFQLAVWLRLQSLSGAFGNPPAWPEFQTMDRGMMQRDHSMADLVLRYIMPRV